MLNEQWLNNRKRCYRCKYYYWNRCLLMCEAPPEEIDTCIRKIDSYKEAVENEGSAEWFMIKCDTTIFMRYLNYKRKDNLPEIGAKVLTLRPGFGGDAGKIRYVKEINDRYIYLVDSEDNTGRKYCSEIKTWYMDFWIL